MNHEWLKILVSALVGMFAGLIAEPLRESLSLRIKTLRVERALAVDCLYLHLAIKTVEQGLAPAANFWKHEMLAGFTYHWEKNREFFYDSLELQTTRLQFQTILKIQQKVEDGNCTSDQGFKEISETLDTLMKPKERNLVQRLSRRFLQLFN